MSYILDALKKSEEQRTGEELPAWNQEEVITPEVDSKPPLRVTIGLLVLLIPVMLWLIYWVLFQTNDDISTGKLAESDLVDIEIISESDIPATPKISEKKIKKISLRDFNKAQGIEEKPKSSVIFSKKPLDVTKVFQKKPRAVTQSTLVTVFELPDSIQRSLPSMTFSGHVYSSDKAKRHIMLNAQRLNEGDAAAAGILLNKITVSGAEFTFKNRRFSLNSLQDWDRLK